MRLLILKIHEALPDRILPMVAENHGEVESARRYRAVVLTSLRQLRGLVDTRLRIVVEPEDAADAVRFWLLPRLADRWQADESVFRTDGWEIEFGGNDEAFAIEAHGDVLCPFLSARWVHTAMLGLERGTHRVSGPATHGGEYFHARPSGANDSLEIRELPGLPIIHNDTLWNEALQSPLGPGLMRAWEEEI
jgi:hypothetical protein